MLDEFQETGKPLCNDLLNSFISYGDSVIDDEGSDVESSPQVSAKLVSRAIELLVENLDLSYVDAVLQAVAYFEIQLSDVKKLLSPQIIDKLREEAIKVHLVRNDSSIEALF